MQIPVYFTDNISVERRYLHNYVFVDGEGEPHVGDRIIAEIEPDVITSAWIVGRVWIDGNLTITVARKPRLTGIMKA